MEKKIEPRDPSLALCQICAESNQWECYVFSVKIIEEGEQ